MSPTPPKTTTVNEPLLREVLTFIQLHPERWDQNTWACGTTACLAGWAYLLATEDYAVTDTEWSAHGLGKSYLQATAAGLLGLTLAQARDLFYFTGVVSDELGRGTRPPTFAELCDKVEAVTGVRFKDGESL